MFTCWNHILKKIIPFFLLSFLLTACQTTPIENGANIGDLSGGAGSEKLFSIVIPENTQGLYIEAAGAEYLELELLDEDEVSLGVCSGASTCALTNPAANTYLIKMTSAQAYSGANISATWGGPTISALANNVAETLIDVADSTLLLKSFFIHINNGPVVFSRIDMPNTQLDVLDQQGTQVATCDSDSDCSVEGLDSGLFIARISVSQQIESGSLSVAWGNSTSGTLQNGVSKTLSATNGQTILESIYIPESLDSIAVMVADEGFDVEIIDAQGNALKACGMRLCIAENIQSGLYYVAFSPRQSAVTDQVKILFGERQYSSLGNGDISSDIVISPNGFDAIALYIDEGAEVAMIQAQLRDIEYSVYNQFGVLVENCISSDPCMIDMPVWGSHYIVLHNRWPDSQVAKLSAAWVGPNLVTMNNGEIKNGLAVSAGVMKLESIYLTEDIDQLMVGVSSFNPVETTIYDRSGRSVEDCFHQDQCRVSQPSPGPYFIGARNIDTQDQVVNISAGWVSQDVTTLNNGDAKANIQLSEMASKIDTFYLPNGADSLIFKSGESPLDAFFYDPYGSEISCFSFDEYCVLSNLVPGGYVVRIENRDNQSVVSNYSIAWGAESYATVANGGLQGSRALAPNHSQFGTFYLPENINSMMLFGNGEFIEFRILDHSGTVLAECFYFNACSVESPVAGAYFVEARNTGGDLAVYDFSIAWAGPGVSTLANGESKTEIVSAGGNSSLESFFVPADAEAIMLRGNGFNTILRVYDSRGHEVQQCSSGGFCFLPSPLSQTYFTRMENAHPESGPVGLSMVMGGGTLSTLENAGRLSSITVSEQSTSLYSFSLDNRLDRFVFELSESFLEISIYDRYGLLIANCNPPVPCFSQSGEAGVHFVVVENLLDASLPFNMAYAWSGISGGSLANGDTLSVSGSPGEVMFNSLHIAQGETLSIAFDNAVQLIQLYDFSGAPLMDCIGSCSFEVPYTGDYFIRIQPTENLSDNQLSVNW